MADSHTRFCVQLLLLEQRELKESQEKHLCYYWFRLKWLKHVFYILEVLSHLTSEVSAMEIPFSVFKKETIFCT